VVSDTGTGVLKTVFGVFVNSHNSQVSKMRLIVYPPKNGIQKIKKFTGFEFTDVEEGFSFDDSAVGKKCSGLAIWGEGMV
jgi:hypothetical protein